MSANNIGMMDGAYFVGRNEILTWINTTLQLGLAKVEEVRLSSLSLSLSPLVPTACSDLRTEGFRRICRRGSGSIRGVFVLGR
jgi:hypothetical protein